MDINKQNTVNIRNKFDTLQKTFKRLIANDEFENIVTTDKEAAAECIPTKPRAKCSVLWESIALRVKEDSMKTTNVKT